jgi:hypothetical protein
MVTVRTYFGWLIVGVYVAAFGHSIAAFLALAVISILLGLLGKWLVNNLLIASITFFAIGGLVALVAGQADSLNGWLTFSGVAVGWLLLYMFGSLACAQERAKEGHRLMNKTQSTKLP